MEDAPNVQVSEASPAVPQVDLPKREAAGDVAAVSEPPAKKARVEEPTESTEPIAKDMRDRGIAPVKAEYVAITSIIRISTNSVFKGTVSRPHPSPVLQKR